MAFWRLGNGFASVSAVDRIMNKPERSLVELLDVSDLLQDLMAPNTQLMEYLRQPEIMQEMVDIILEASKVSAEKESSGAPRFDTESEGEEEEVDGSSREDNSRHINNDTTATIGAGTSIEESSASKSASASMQDSSSKQMDADINDNTSQDKSKIAISEESQEQVEDDDSENSPLERVRSHQSDSENDVLDDTEFKTGTSGSIEDAKADNNDKSIDEEKNDEAVLDDHEETADKASKHEHDRWNTEEGVDASLEDKEEEDEDEEDEDGDDDNDDEDEEDDDDYFETLQRRAHVCSEILSAEVWSITETLMERTDLVEQLWTLLDYPEPVSVTLASCFSKINEHLLEKNIGDMVLFIRSQNNFVERFMKHIENPPLMDFLLKVISSDKPDNSTGIIDFLQSQKLIPHLISFLAPDVPSSVQTAAGDFLKAFITISANSSNDNSTIGPNELSRELVSDPCISELLRLMLYGGTGLATGVGIIIEIIRKNNSDYDYMPVMYVTMDSHPPGPRDPIYLGTMVRHFAEAIPQFQEMLVRDHPERLKTSFGEIEPLGFERFKVCELIAELLHCSNMALLNDPGAEAVVQARDDERRRVKEVVARAKGELDGAEVNEVEDASEDRGQGQDQDDQAKNDEDSSKITEDDDRVFQTTEAATEAGTESESEENSKNDDSRTSGNADDAEMSEQAADYPDNDHENLEQQIESLNIDSDTRERAQGDDSTLTPYEEAMSLEEYEQYLRKNPVAGDQLKIALANNNCITTFLDMFFRFPCNNFLHNVVFDIVQQILNARMQKGYNKYLAIQLFGKGELTRFVCNGRAKNEEHEAATGIRLGYMGHLTLIAEEIVKFTALYSAESISPEVVQAVTLPEWINYVTHTLVQTRDQYNTVLGGQQPEDESGLLGGLNNNAVMLGHSGSFGANDGDDDDQDDFEDAHSDHQRIYRDDDDDDDTGFDKDDTDPSSFDEVGGAANNDQGDDDEDGGNGSGGGQFARYLSAQMSGTGAFTSSDDDDEDDDEWEPGRNHLLYQGFGRSSYEEDDDDSFNEDTASHDSENASLSTSELKSEGGHDSYHQEYDYYEDGAPGEGSSAPGSESSSGSGTGSSESRAQTESKQPSDSNSNNGSYGDGAYEYYDEDLALVRSRSYVDI